MRCRFAVFGLSGRLVAQSCCRCSFFCIRYIRLVSKPLTKDGLRFGFSACLPSFSCASSGDEVRLSYHGNQAFNEGASCTARSNSPPTEPSARRLARRNSTSRTHHVDSTEEAQATRKNRR